MVSLFIERYIQSVIPAMYPVLKDNWVYLRTNRHHHLVFQTYLSLVSTFVGQYADRWPQPYSLSAGMCFTLTGYAASRLKLLILLAAYYRLRFFGIPPRLSRVAQIASGQESLAQSIFQVGETEEAHRTITRRIDYYSLRATCRRVVFNRSIARLCHTVRVGYWHADASQTGMSHRAQQTTSCNLSKKATAML